jgi:PAS domain S-box-containing protein
MPRTRRLLLAVILLAVYVAADLALRRIALPGSGIIPLYPGAGLALAYLTITGWPGAFVLVFVRLGLFGGRLPQDATLSVIVVEAVLQTVAYTFAAEAIRRRVLAGLDSWRIKHAVWLIGASVLPAVFAAIVAALQLTLTRGAGPSLWLNALTFAAADIAGTLVVLPVALLALRPVFSPAARTGGAAQSRRRARWQQRRTERIVSAAVMIATIAAGVWLAGHDVHGGFAYLQILCILPVGWIAIREGFDGAAFVVAVYGVAWTIIAASLGITGIEVPEAQASLLALAIVGLLLGAARTESDESSAAYWHMLATAGEGVWRVDAEGRSLYLNDQMVRMLGVPVQAVLGREVIDFIHPDDRERWAAERARRAQGQDTLYQVRLIRPDGTSRHVLVRGSVVRSTTGAAMGAIAIVTDITPLREAEASRQRAQVLLEAAFRSSRDAMALFRASDEVIVDVNDVWCQLTGYTRDEAIGRSQRDLDLWADPADSARFRDAMREHGAVRDFEIPFHRHLPDGRTELGHGLLSAIPVVDGDETFFFAIARDITSERRREAAERQLRRLEELGRLSGSISHDFNNLLTVVLGYAQLAKMDVNGNTELAADLAEIEQAAQRGQLLTKRLLAFSRSQAVETRVIDLRSIIDRSHGMLRSVIGPAVTLEIEQASRPLMIVADPSQVDQILLNLAANARDAMNGTGTLTVRSSAITASAGRVADTVGPGALPGDYAVLEVEDTGAGMDEAIQSRIFEPFFTTKAPEEGTGLGLAVVFGIVRQARGAIRVTSSPGRGARFTIFWPEARVAAVTATPAHAATETEEHRAWGARIMLVEDDEAVRRIVRRVLEDAGYEVHVASNGINAIAALERLEREGHPASAVLSDVVMPEMGGRALAEQLLATRPDLPVLLLSGHVGTDEDLRASLPNVREVMTKPFDVQLMLRAIARVVSERA